MNRVLYEVSFQWHGAYFEAGILFVIALIFFLFYRKKRFELDTKMQVAWFFSGFIAAGALLAQIWIGVSAIRDYQQVVLPYEAGNYQTVSGKIENFTTLTPEGKGAESFEIDGVSFSYVGYNVYQGYPHSATSGGVIKGDGQALKVGYVEKNGENIIVYIEEISP